MKTIYVTTPDNIEVEYRLAGAGSRAGAAVIDTILQAIVFFVVLLLAFAAVFDFSLAKFEIAMENAANIIAFVILAYFIIFFGYFIVCEIVMKGRTIGKKVFGLRTIRQNGQPITFIHSIIRNIIRVIIDNNGIGIIVMIFSKSNKRLGDMLAGTIVIAENPNKFTTESLLFAMPQDYNKAVSLEGAYTVTVEEYEILKDYFARKESLLSGGSYAGMRVQRYFEEKYQLPQGMVNDAFLYELMNKASMNV